MSKYNKAIVALFGGILAMLGVFGIEPEWATEGLLESVAAVLTPILVYLVPNKAAE